MQATIKRRSVYTITQPETYRKGELVQEERVFEVEFEPDDYTQPIIRDLPDGRVVVGYLSHDDDCENPLTFCDGMGQIHDRRRDSRREEIEAFYAAFGVDEDGNKVGKPNPYAVLLDVYEHSGTAWSIRGEGTQCRWDTSRGAGVWVPTGDLIQHIEVTALLKVLPEGCDIHCELDGTKTRILLTLPDGTKHGPYKSRINACRAATRRLGIKIDKEALQKFAREEAVVCCRSAIEEYNKWLMGDCWGVVTEIHKLENGEYVRQEDAEHCWGHVGREFAEECLKDEVAAEE